MLFSQKKSQIPTPDYHQQYLAKVSHGYCGFSGTGLSCPIGTGVKAKS